LRAQGGIVPDDLLAHVAPLGWEHIGLTGDYVWTAPDHEHRFARYARLVLRSRRWRLSVQF
jgi:Tn3 transposase DDE domain